VLLHHGTTGTVGGITAFLAWLLIFLSGCSSDAGPTVVPVEGRVILDDEPLADARVVFQPEHGRPSEGKTDKNGYYELEYTADKAGAIVGKHTVRITTQQTIVGEDYKTTEIPERVPPKYNIKSELIREVAPDASENVFNFDLKSK